MPIVTIVVYNYDELLKSTLSKAEKLLSVHLYFWHTDNLLMAASIETGLAQNELAMYLKITEFSLTSLAHSAEYHNIIVTYLNIVGPINIDVLLYLDLFGDQWSLPKCSIMFYQTLAIGIRLGRHRG